MRLGFEVTNGAIIEKQSELHAASDPGAQGFPEQLLHPLAVLGMNLVKRVTADQRFRIAQQWLIAAAVESAFTLLVGDRDQVADVICQDAEEFFGPPEFVF